MGYKFNPFTGNFDQVGMSSVPPGSVTSSSGSSTDNAIARFDGTSGVIIQSSGATIDDSGNITATNLSGTNTGDQTITLTGDASGSGTSTIATTLATVNGSPGSFGDASHSLSATVNGKGLITSLSSQSIQITESQVTNLVSDLAATEKTVNKGAANGYAPLDGSAKVPYAYLPSALMTFKGAWDASTNTPTLVDGTGTTGDTYRASVAGTQNLGSGPQTWAIGDFNIYNGTIWQHSPAADGVSSVNGQAGAVTVNAINQLTGDVTAGPAAQSQSKVATIAAIQGTTVSGTTGTGNVVFSASPTLTGTITAAAANFSGAISASNFSGSSSGSNTGDQTITLTGDVTGSGTGSFATTLATVNGNVGSFGSSTSIPSITVNAKGLVTAASGNVVIAPAGTLTGTTLAANVVNSSLTSVGTITSGTWNGTTIDIGHGGTGQVTAAAAYNALSPMTTTGDIEYEASANTAARLPIGSTGNVLTVVGGIPSWQPPSAVSPGAITLTQNHILVGNASNVAADVAMSGDTTIVASGAVTLATVNANTGSFGSSTAIPSFTVNGKGLITAASTNAVVAPAGTLTGTTLAANVVSSSLTSVGTITTGTWTGTTIATANGGTGQTTYTDGQLLIGNSSGNTLTKSTLTQGSGITITNGNGSITIAELVPPSAGDIKETSFTAADNQSSPANVTGLAFANGTVRSADILLSIVRNTTYAQYKINVVQAAASWYINQSYVGDDTGLVFTITTAGQIQYTSTSTGSTATLKFRAITTSV